MCRFILSNVLVAPQKFTLRDCVVITLCVHRLLLTLIIWLLWLTEQTHSKLNIQDQISSTCWFHCILVSVIIVSFSFI